MGLTPHALEHMGFRRRREDEILAACFASVYVFEVHGLGTETRAAERRH